MEKSYRTVYRTAKSHRIACAVMALILIVCTLGTAFSSAAGSDPKTYTIYLYPEYLQTDARTMLSEINAFRMGSEAWWYTDDTKGPTQNANTAYQDTSGNNIALGYLQIDPDLEKVAMQRAAEISLMFSHTRPNGTKYTTAYPIDETADPQDIFAWKGENIAAGTNMDMQAAFNAWKEDAYGYSGQGHRRNMLNANYTRIGIAHAKIDGIDYWVQEFGKRYDDTYMGSSSAVDGEKKVRIELLEDVLDPNDPPAGGYTPPEGNEVVVEYGGQKDPKLVLLTYTPPGVLGPSAFESGVFMLAPIDASDPDDTIKLPDGTYLSKDKKVSPLESEYTVKDPAIASVNDMGVITGEKVGTTEITVSAPKYNIPGESFAVRVIPADLKNAEINLEEDTFEYTGEEHKPVAHVFCNGRLLDEGKDYTVSYSNNVSAGHAAKVIITAVEGGNYSGAASTDFTINGTSIKDAVVTLEYTTTEYTGTERKPAVISYTVGDITYVAQSASGETPDGTGGGSGGTKINVKEGTDFTVAYENNVNAGTAKAIVSGTGKYMDNSIPAEFTITPKSIEKATLTPEYTSTYYDGSPLTPNGEVKLEDGTVLVKDQDYTLSYANNNAAGTATVTATGKGNYSGATSAQFTITPECQHDFDSGKETKAATCTAKGVKTFTCTKCGKKKTEDIPMLKHTEGPAATCSSPQKCTTCGTVLAAATGKHTDANNDGKCDVCNATVSNGNNNGSKPYSPATGDRDPWRRAAIIAGVTAAVIAAATGTFLVRRRRIKRAVSGCITRA